MTTVQRVIEAIEALAPRRLALEGDATGLQVGDPRAEVTRVLCTLDLTLAVAEEARALGAGLVVSHHAVVFRPLKELRTDGPGGRLLATLLKGDVAVYVPHTALDVARGGTNDALAARLGLGDVTVLERTGRGADAELGIGRLGRLPAPGPALEVASRLKALLEAPYAHLVSRESTRRVERVAVLAGDGRRYVEAAAAAGADLLVTGDVDHHTALLALARGLALLDVGHWASERQASLLLADGLRGRLPGVEVLESRVETQPFRVI